MSQRYFAQVSPGLEELCARELHALGARKRVTSRGGVSFEGTKKHLYRALLMSRLPSRLWLTLSEGSAPNPNALFERVRRAPLPDHLPEGGPLALRVALHHTPGLAGEGQARSVIYSALKASFEARSLTPPYEVPWAHKGSHDHPTQRLLAHVERGRLTLRLDASGELLHKRGWRTEDGAAPLRPTLASACLQALEWSPEEALLDLMCGSGTFSVEALSLALQRSPHTRRFACERWVSFQPEGWARVMEEQQAPQLERLEGLRWWVSDQSEAQLSLAKAHINAYLSAQASSYLSSDATSSGAIQPPQALIPTQANALELTWEHVSEAWSEPLPERGLIIVNPPYGRRVSRLSAQRAPSARQALGWADESSIAQQLVSRLPELIPSPSTGSPHPWRAGVLLPTQQRLTPPQGWEKHAALTFSHGGIPVTLWRLQPL